MKPGIDRTRIDPQYLLELIEPVAQVYRAMEHDLIVKLARRFDPKKLKRGVVQDLREQGQGGGVYESFMLSQVGALRDDCIQTIAEYAGDISQASTAAIEQSVTDAIGVIEPEFTGTTPVPVSDTVRRVTGLYESQAINRQNLVNTVMLNSTLAHYRESVRDVTKLMRQLQTTQEALNTDTGQLIQGETTLRQAIASTLGKVAESGLAGFVDRAGREWDAEAYVRMDMKTTTANTAREAVFERNSDYGNNLIMVSSHPGARPGCEPWQGRIYSTDGSSGTVEDLHGKTYEYIPLGDTSYGEPAGLFGINCGHFPSPFFAGQSVMRWPQYDHEETVRLYRESQEQRYMERKVRKEKTRADALEAAGDLQGAKAARKRAREMNAELKAWCAEKGREYYPERTRVVRAETPAKEIPLTGNTGDSTIRMMSAKGGRNTVPLTEEQVSKAIDFAVSLGMPRENIEYNDNWHTSYWYSFALDGFAEHLHLGPDLYPALDGKTANQKISWKGAIGHEVIGHRATCMRKTNGLALSAYDEAQASLRAAKFTPELSSYDRRMLRQDAKERLKREGLKFKSTIRRMDIWEE